MSLNSELPTTIPHVQLEEISDFEAMHALNNAVRLGIRRGVYEPHEVVTLYPALLRAQKWLQTAKQTAAQIQQQNKQAAAAAVSENTASTPQTNNRIV